MYNRKVKFVHGMLGALLSLTLITSAMAAEKIIQQEAIAFDKCLKVIATSENKLSIAPEIKDVSDKKRIAVFTLIDGTLKITCDGAEGVVVVSTSSN